MITKVAEDEREIILQAKAVGKLYSRSRDTTRARLSRSAWRSFFGLPAPRVDALKASEFWAVKDVSFDLRRGEAVGIIGLNGSGKTTLLRMLAGQVLPDAGEISIRGTSAAMIDLTAGFQAAASGRENIYLRAAALGFDRPQTQTRMKEIVDFCELGEALDAPLATYSSGMKMRLAFSIMAIVAPDVLIIDEVLAVGDFRFRQKCLGKIREMRSRSAFVFVSHSMGDIGRFCDRVIVMHKGRVHFEGPPSEAIDFYQQLSPTETADEAGGSTAVMGPVFDNSQVIADATHIWVDERGNPVERIEFQDRLRLKIGFRSLIDVRSLIIGVPIWNINSQYITGLSTQITSDRFEVKAGEYVDIVLETEPGMVNPGVVKSMFAVMDGPEHIYRKANPDLVISATAHPTWGAVTIPHKWTRKDSSNSENAIGGRFKRSG